MKSFFLAPILLLAGCRNSASGYIPVPPAEIPAAKMEAVKRAQDLMPLDVGNHWRYALRIQDFDKDDKPRPEISGKIDMDIAARWPNGTAVLVISYNGNVIDRQAWFGDDSGLYQVEGGVESVPFRPSLPVFTLPIKAGQHFTWHGRGPLPRGGAGQVRAECDVLPPQNVDLTKAAVSAIPIVTRLTYPQDTKVNTSWFQPGVGIVRMHEETKSKGKRNVTILTLTEHTTKSR